MDLLASVILVNADLQQVSINPGISDFEVDEYWPITTASQYEVNKSMNFNAGEIKFTKPLFSALKPLEIR